ncbi:MAG: hypothetical protein R2706_05625 [Acidimicrobiales bacterium]
MTTLHDLLMDPAFEPPGPGHWKLDRSHYPGGTTLVSQWLMTETSLAGTKRVFAENGVPAEGIDTRFSRGFSYARMRPLVRPDQPTERLPPLAVLRLATRLHPAFRRREKLARRSIEHSDALAVARRWSSEIRPELVARNRALQDIELGALSDSQLEEHLGDLLDHARAQFELHFWLHGHDLGPIAKYLHQAVRWGLEPGRAVSALGGASPSTARPGAALFELRQLVEQSGVPIDSIQSIDDLHGLSNKASRLLDDYLNEWGHVVCTGYDVTNRTLIELPSVVVRSVLSATKPEVVDTAAIATELAESLPQERRAEFAELLHDARFVMDMRDDNGPLTVEWPVGLVRQALLETGRRLQQAGSLPDADFIFELSVAELRNVFRSGPPDSIELQARAEKRHADARLTPPETLGPVEPEPPIDVLPPFQARLVGMVKTTLEHLGFEGRGGRNPMEGFGIGNRSYIGTARIATSAEGAIDRLEPGEVLIVRATSPAFNSVLAIAGAVVTGDGGMLSRRSPSP